MKLHSATALIILSTLSLIQVSAQQNTSADTVHHFTNARIIVGNGDYIEQASLLIRDGIILDSGTTAAIDIPEDAVTHDLSGKTIMPALVNAHAHLGWEAYSDWGSEHFTTENLTDHLYRHAYYGVGTIISTGSDKEEIAKQVQLDQLRNNIGGARYHQSPGMGTPGGGPNPRFTDDPGYWGVNAISTPAEAIQTVRELTRRGHRIAKIWVDDRDTERGAQVKLSPETYGAVLQAANIYDMRIIAHATTLMDHKSLVQLGNRRFIHMPYDRPVDDEYLEMARDNNVYIAPTLNMITKREPYFVPAFADPFFQEQVPQSVLDYLESNYNPGTGIRSAAAEQRSAMLAGNLFKLKDHIILGTDAGAVGDFFGYTDHVEVALFVRMGMTPMEAIVAATSRPAEAFGLDNVGVLQAGKAADFVILDASPLDNINNTRQINEVYIRGQRVDREGLRARWAQEN